MDLFIALGAPLIVGVILLLLKSLHSRISVIEHKDYMAKDDIRELIEDKVGGIREDVKEIRTKVDKLFDLYISDHK